MFELHTDATDDPGFVSAVNGLLRGAVLITEPRRLTVVKTDNWFGRCWLGFSYKVIGAIGVAHRPPTVIPPFVPNRVVSQSVFTADSGGTYRQDPCAADLHVRQTSMDNGRRKLSGLVADSALVWWSGCSAASGRGSVMAYVPAPGGHMGWYVEAKGPAPWRPGYCRGLPRTLVGSACVVSASLEDVPQQASVGE